MVPQHTTQEPTVVDIRAEALANDDFRRVVRTGMHEQVVLMTLPEGGSIGAEVHDETDQLFVFMDGTGEARVGGETIPVEAGDLVFVEAGTRHDIVNRGSSPLRLVTVYAPPEHEPGTVHRTKAEAEAAEH
jgi:mannose-6-phosphate isomerase-like protein (cupin superfamily)